MNWIFTHKMCTVYCLLFTHPARHGSCALMRLLSQWARCDHRLESHEHQCTRAASSWNTWDESRALSARHVSVTCASLLLRPLGHFIQTGEWWPTLPHSFKEYCSHTVLSCNLKYNVVLDTGEELTRLFCLYFDDSPNAIFWFQDWKFELRLVSKSKVLIQLRGLL